jgi:hypothetical protein
MAFQIAGFIVVFMFLGLFWQYSRNLIAIGEQILREDYTGLSLRSEPKPIHGYLFKFFGYVTRVGVFIFASFYIYGFARLVSDLFRE